MNAHRAQGRGSHAVLVAVAAVSGLAGLGAAVAVVVSSDDVQGGKPTPTAVADALVAAWAVGDGDRAVALMPSYDELTAALECPRVEESDGRARHAHARAEVWAKARVWEQRHPRVRLIAPAALNEKGVDEELGRCRTLIPFAMQTVAVSVELDGGGHGGFDVNLTIVKLGARWYLMDAGELPTSRLDEESRQLVAEREARRERRENRRRIRTGYDDDDLLDDDDEDMADRSMWAAMGGPSSAVVAKFRTVRDLTCACKDLECLAVVERDLAKVNESYDATKATDDDHRAVQKVLDERNECVAKLRATAAPRTGVPACDEYIRYIEWYMSCDKIPQSARDGMQQGLDAMRQAWSDSANMPDEARSAMSDSCQTGVDALRQAGDAMGCGTLL